MTYVQIAATTNHTALTVSPRTNAMTRPGDGADHGDDSEDDLVPDGDGRAVDDRDGWQVVVGADQADIFVVHSHAL